MKHTLPWNVNGIPPEARELARSAAQREGATVGEWLTRRIMTDEARKMPATEPPDELTPSLRYSHETEEATRRADDFPARMPRTETPSDATIRRIDETFRNLARRLENNERAQVEAQLAMNAAAAEINAATRDQAQAFKLLTSRIDRAERHTDTGALRDAVRGLHQGLSRLSDQIAKTTIESSGKVTALSGAVEQLAGKMLAARDESNLLFQAVDEKLAALDARVNRHEERFAETGERLDSAARLDETVSALERRMDSIEQRVQQSLGQYLGGIERGLEQISERLQRAEKQSRSEEALEETVRNLAARFEAIEASDKPAAPQPETENVEIEIIDTATADDSPIAAEAPAPDETLTFETFLPAPAPSAMDSPLFVGNSDVTPPAAEESQAVAPAQPVHVSTENYLAHARRAARPIAEADGDRFSMRSQIHVPDGARSDQHRRTARALAAGFLVVLLLAAGAMLTRNSQSRASALTPNSTNLIALDVPKSGIGEASATTAAPSIFPAPQQPADTNAPAANAATSRIAAASVFAFGDAGTSSLAQLMARANTGDAMAEMSLGLKYADGDGVPANETEAAFWLQKAAEAGQAVAQYRLGTLYERGRGVPTDAHQALRWYGEAASHGNRRAMHNLAVVYADGTGTEKNFQEAARWFKDAAELGLTDSQFNLAVLYERGLGVKESLAEAYKWYAIAAASGDAESKARLEALTNQITPADRKAADDAAKAYKPRPIDIAANNG